MKICMQPIESIVWFTKEGIPHPLKYRILAKDKSYKTIKLTLPRLKPMGFLSD